MTVTPSHVPSSLSLETTAVVTERSKRTWQRRMADGGIERVSDDLRGRTMVRLVDMKPFLCVPMATEDLEALSLADGGSADAQCDVGQVFDLHGKPEIAIYWWTQAADQGDAEAMQCLGRAYAEGRGVPRDANLALMWIARAAAKGHPIARAQIEGLMPCVN